MSKQKLRELMLARRNALSEEERLQAAEDCAARLVQRAPFRHAPIIFCYRAFGSELPLDVVLQMTHALNKPVAFPRVLDDENMEFVVGGVLQKGFWGIPEPRGGEVVVPTPKDLMLLPGLAFTEKGDRLGYGKGYYDRYLAKLKALPSLWGVTYDQLLCDHIPTQPWDIRMDAILTPKKIIRCGR